MDNFWQKNTAYDFYSNILSTYMNQRIYNISFFTIWFFTNKLCVNYDFFANKRWLYNLKMVTLNRKYEYISQTVGCPENAKSLKSQAPQGFSGCS